MDILEKSYHNYEIKLSKEKQTYLTFENPLLVSCTLIQNEDLVNFKFNINGYYKDDDIQKLSKLDKLRFLINCEQLNNLRKSYGFSIQPENIVFDINLCPKIVMRDAPESLNNFTNEYKALIGSVINPKYKYEDYYLGGKDLYKKKSILKKLKFLNSTDEIKNYLLEEYNKELENIKKNKLLVNKKSIIATRIAVPVVCVAFILLCIKGYFVLFIDAPFQKGLVSSANAYISEDYEGVQKSLKNINVNKIPVEEKFMLAKSYIITEGLTPEQKQNILAGISLKTDQRILNYWIELGRLNFDSAIDYSKQIGDNELLMFSLIKKSVYTKSDTTITGEKKAELIKQLDDEIKTLKEQIQKQDQEANKSSVNVTTSTTNGDNTK